jgi:hypothetical protein
MFDGRLRVEADIIPEQLKFESNNSGPVANGISVQKKGQ